MKEPYEIHEKKPIWIYVSLSIVLVVGVTLFVIKSGQQKVIKDRNALIKSLNESEDPKGNAFTVQEFITFMNSQPDNDRGRDNVIAAITTLARLQGDDVDKAISTQLAKIKAGNSIIRSGLIGVMVDKGYVEAVPKILDFINDNDNEVADAAVYAVGELGDLQNVEVLLDSLATASGKRADALEGAVIRICLKESNPDIRNTEVRRILGQESPTGDYRKRILRILGSLGGKKAWTDLKRILDGNDPDGRKAVLQTIGSWPNSAPLKTLNGIIFNEKDEVIKRLAFRAYVLLLSDSASIPDESKCEEIAKLFELNFSKNDKLILIGALSTLATEKALKLASEVGDQNESYKRSADLASKKISDNISKVVKFNDSEKVYSAEGALVMGEEPFSYSVSAAAVIGWKNPYYYIVWPINFSEAGTYELILNHQKPSAGGGDFEVVLGADKEMFKVSDSDTFEDKNLGSFSVQNPGTYRLIIRGLNLENNDGELMNVRSVGVKKSD